MCTARTEMSQQTGRVILSDPCLPGSLLIEFTDIVGLDTSPFLRLH
jgi:hypothetical protein